MWLPNLRRNTASGGQRGFLDLVIEATLSLDAACGLRQRQIDGVVRRLPQLAGAPTAVHTTLAARSHVL